MRDNQDYKHRMATRTIRLLDQHGSPLRNQEVGLDKRNTSFYLLVVLLIFCPCQWTHSG